jgi:hypothetical protein
MLAIINRDTLQLETLVRAAGPEHQVGPFVAIPCEEYDPQAAFDKHGFSLLELQILYRNITGDHVRNISAFRGNVASAIQVTLRYGKPISAGGQTVWDSVRDTLQDARPRARPAAKPADHSNTPAKPKAAAGTLAPPAPGSVGARVWAALDANPAAGIKDLAATLDINESTVRGNASRWKQYHGK